jgi:hypothetical protein
LRVARACDKNRTLTPNHRALYSATPAPDGAPSGVSTAAGAALHGRWRGGVRVGVAAALQHAPQARRVGRAPLHVHGYRARGGGGGVLAALPARLGGRAALHFHGRWRSDYGIAFKLSMAHKEQAPMRDRAS